MRGTRRTSGALGMLLVLGLGLLGAGCSGSWEARQGADGNIVIALTPADGTTPATATPTTPGTPAAPAPATTVAPPAPPSPDYTTPAPTAPSPPLAPIPASAQDQANELKTKYGIELSGEVTERDVRNTLVSARQYRPDETTSLKIYFAPGNRQGGVMGMYSPGSSNGQMEIYDHVNLHTVHHELVHHITLFPRNTRAQDIAKRVIAMVPPEQGTLAEADPAYIPRSYARQDGYEFWAEFFSYLREKEKGIQGGYPCSSAFNPAENVRAVARQIYAD